MVNQLNHNHFIRDYDANSDLKAVARIWQECGWIDDAVKEADIAKLYFNSAEDALVATMDGEPECAAISTRGTMRYLDETLSMGAVAAVTTSRIGRKQGFAQQLTVRLLARQALAGHKVSALGMFDQGFYDRLGFGTGPYEQTTSFDPATLIVDQPYRTPKRLSIDDSRDMFFAMMNRRISHGGVTIDSVDSFHGELQFTKKPFGLGYCDNDGTLTHFIWGETSGENGPYRILFCAYQNKAQLLELLALMKSLGDQVDIIKMLEFGDLQLQDLLKQPFRSRRASNKAGQFVQVSVSSAYWQARILDLPGCIAQTHLNTPDLRFNLHLADPVTELLPTDSTWRGVAGDYVVRLGQDSRAEPGIDSALPDLSCSVNSFTRLWLGVRPASHLVHSTDLDASDKLIHALDRHLCLPKPHLGWDF